MKPNKIIIKTLKPQLITLSAFTILGFTCAGLLNQRAADLEQEYKIKKESVSNFSGILAGFIAFAFICLMWFSYKNVQDFTSENAQKYIKKQMSKNPEFEQFKPILSNPHALRNFATFISNELQDFERKRIVNLIYGIELASTDEQIENVHNEVIKVIKEHASIHPEFAERVYSELVHENYMMYVKQKQHANSTQKTK